MGKGFVDSVLSTQKRRQLFYYARNLTSLLIGVGIYQYLGGVSGLFFGLVSVVIGYLTIAPVIAFLICLFEQMHS